MRHQLPCGEKKSERLTAYDGPHVLFLFLLFSVRADKPATGIYVHDFPVYEAPLSGLKRGTFNVQRACLKMVRRMVK